MRTLLVGVAQHLVSEGGFHREQQRAQNMGALLILLALAQPQGLTQRRAAFVTASHAPALHAVERPQAGVAVMPTARFTEQQQRLALVAAQPLAAGAVEPALDGIVAGAVRCGATRHGEPR